MPQDRYQTRLPADDAERVDEYVDEHDISQSEGVRRLIRAGLDAELPEEEGPVLDTLEQSVDLVSAILTAAIAGIVAYLGINVASALTGTGAITLVAGLAGLLGGATAVGVLLSISVGRKAIKARTGTDFENQS